MRRHLLSLAVIMCAATAARADDWPQWLGPQRDGVWREQGIVEKFPAGGPKQVWKTPLGLGYAGPAVANGRVYVTDWVPAKGAKFPKSPFSADPVPGQERVLCLDGASGKVLWTHAYDRSYEISYPSGPRCTPVVSGGKVWTLGAMGDLRCLDADSGKLIWSKDLLKEYNATVPFWGFASHPLLDGDRLITLVGGPGSAAVAFDKDTGKELWRNLSAPEIGYAPPMVYEFAGKKQVIIWHPVSVNGLEPETGKLIWSQKFGTKVGKKGKKEMQIGAGMSIPTPRKSGDLLFLTAFYDGSMALKFDKGEAPRVLWQAGGRSENPGDTKALHCVMSTPFIEGDYVYGVCSYGELRAIELKTGERKWQTHAPVAGDSLRWGNAFLVPHGDRVFLFNEKGELIIGKVSPEGFKEIDKAKILSPTNRMAPPPGRRVVWMHPAFANRSVYARNDEEIVCVSLAAEK